MLRNTGDRAWSAAAGDALVPVTGAAFVPDGAIPLVDTRDDIPTYGGLFRGRPRAFTFEVVGPCEAGAHDFTLRMSRDEGTPFGETVGATITVP